MTRTLVTSLLALTVSNPVLALGGQEGEDVILDGTAYVNGKAHPASGTATINGVAGSGELLVETARRDLDFDVDFDFENKAIELWHPDYDGFGSCWYGKTRAVCGVDMKGPRGSFTMNIIIDITDAG
jgi:hypothetical protein